MTKPIISAEEQLACELITYIEAQPPHFAGLCFYLNSGPNSCDALDHSEPLIAGYSYQMIDAVRGSGRWKPWYGNYIAPINGPHPERIKFAEFLLDLVMTGQLTFNSRAQDWVCAPKNT